MTYEKEKWAMGRARCFHEVKIGPVVFRGTVTIDGPAIAAWLGNEFLGEAPLGICSIAHDGAWYVVKYVNERLIPLTALSDPEREQLMREFGIGLLDNKIIGLLGRRKLGLDDPFFSSPAFGGLCRWVRQHQKLAKKYAECQHYLGDWHSRAWTSSYKAPLRPVGS